MTADPTTATKLCTVCGIDCAGKPRIKDQQGRYICKECFDKAKQTRQTQKNPPAPAPAAAGKAPAPADGDNSFLLELGSKESTGIAGTKACPECGRAMPSNAVICIGCGFNTSTGKRHTVKVIKAKKEKGPPGAAAVAVQAGSSLILAVVGSAIGGAIGAGIWAGVAAATGYQVGYIAWAVGGLTGAGASIGARGYAGLTSGLVAAGMSVLAILGGKYAAGSIIFNTSPDIWFPQMFGLLDILFFFLAIGTALKVGSVEMGSGKSS